MHDDLVKRLWECASGECFNCSQYTETANTSVCRKELMKQAADAIEELSVVVRAQKAVLDKFPRWIPVTEQLPDAEKEVYVTDGEYIARAILLDEVFPGDKPCWSYSGLGEITHWCAQIPLPQPPKEE